MYRIAIGEISHETNTFCAEPTSVEPFKRYQWQRGAVGHHTRRLAVEMLDGWQYSRG